MDNGQNQERSSSKKLTAARDDQNPVYYYEDSGIQEQHGHVPVWLSVVAISLLVWGVYYMIANWSPPAP